jgi:hypothetical protein
MIVLRHAMKRLKAKYLELVRPAEVAIIRQQELAKTEEL